MIGIPPASSEPKVRISTSRATSRPRASESAPGLDCIWYHPKWYAEYVPDPDIEGEMLEGKLSDTPASGELTPQARV